MDTSIEAMFRAEKATPRQIREHYRALGYQCRISRDGHVRFRPDDAPRGQDWWREGRWVGDYWVYDREGVVLI